MKLSIVFSLAIIASLLSLNSCNQAEQQGQLSIGLDMLEESLQKSTSTRLQVTTALVSIMAEDGSLFYDKEPLEIIRFGDAIMTRSLKLPVGGYTLTEFMLTDSSGVVLWATPKADSKLANLVKNPLPLYFRIHADEATSMPVQVIRVGNYTPGDFGYAEFNIDFVERFCLKVAYTQDCPHWETDSLYGPDGNLMPFYQARLKVFVYDRMVLNEPMVQGENKYALPLVDGHYVVVATGCDGSTIFKADFGREEITRFRCNPDFPALQIPGGDDPDIKITPEGLYEPNIKQGLFGRIEAPLDSYMDSILMESSILVQDIHIFPYHVLDSIFTMAPIDCYIAPEFLPMDPIAKVRSNSDGYFQLEMRQGEYLYLVKTGEGYYMDAFISSHEPGYFRIYPEEVTQLFIMMMGCSMWM